MFLPQDPSLLRIYYMRSAVSGLVVAWSRSLNAGLLHLEHHEPSVMTLSSLGSCTMASTARASKLFSYFFFFLEALLGTSVQKKQASKRATRARNGTHHCLSTRLSAAGPSLRGPPQTSAFPPDGPQRLYLKYLPNKKKPSRWALLERPGNLRSVVLLLLEIRGNLQQLSPTKSLVGETGAAFIFSIFFSCTYRGEEEPAPWSPGGFSGSHGARAETKEDW